MNPHSSCRRTDRIAAWLVALAGGALAGCASEHASDHRPAPRRGEDAVVWAAKDQLVDLRSPLADQRRAWRREWWRDALAGEVPVSFVPAEQADESAEKIRRAWFGPTDPLR